MGNFVILCDNQVVWQLKFFDESYHDIITRTIICYRHICSLFGLEMEGDLAIMQVFRTSGR